MRKIKSHGWHFGCAPARRDVFSLKRATPSRFARKEASGRRTRPKTGKTPKRNNTNSRANATSRTQHVFFMRMIVLFFRRSRETFRFFSAKIKKAKTPYKKPFAETCGKLRKLAERFRNLKVVSQASMFFLGENIQKVLKKKEENSQSCFPPRMDSFRDGLIKFRGFATCRRTHEVR